MVFILHPIFATLTYAHPATKFSSSNISPSLIKCAPKEPASYGLNAGTNSLSNLYLAFAAAGLAHVNDGEQLEKQVLDWGFENFNFDWIINPDMAIYAVVIAGVWQASGFVMALFLAGLRSVDSEIIKAAQVDGIPGWRIYSAIIIPSMAPIFLSAFIVLAHLAIKSFDLVIALTGGGPGYATDLPATYMYAMAFSRGNIGQAASSAMVMMMVIFAIVVPYLYSELRGKKNA